MFIPDVPPNECTLSEIGKSDALVQLSVQNSTKTVH